MTVSVARTVPARMVAMMVGMGGLIILLIAAVFTETVARAIMARISGGCPEGHQRGSCKNSGFQHGPYLCSGALRAASIPWS